MSSPGKGLNERPRLVIVQNRPTQFDPPLYAHLHATGDLELTVFYTRVPSGGGELIDRETGIPSRWDHLPQGAYDSRRVQSLRVLIREIRALHPDHVVIGGWYPRAHALLALILRAQGFSVGVRSDNSPEHMNLSSLEGRIKRALTSALLHVYSAWHPVGILAEQYLRTTTRARRGVFLFPYAVDVEWFRARSSSSRLSRDEMRKDCGLRAEDFVVLGIMKWTEREDPMTLIDAVRRAARRDSTIRLLLVGDGPLSGQVMQRLKSLEAPAVTPGYVKYSDLPAYYAIADVFVHPAKSEPFGVSVQEALACGLPVLVSDGVGSRHDFVQAGRNGDVFPVGDADRLASLILAWCTRAGDPSVVEAAVSAAMTRGYGFTESELRRCLRG